MKVQYASDLHLEFPENKAFLMADPLQVVGNVLQVIGIVFKYFVFYKAIIT